MLKQIYLLYLICFLFHLLPVDSAASEWVVLRNIDRSKKSERIRYAKFLKEQHYQIPYMVIPELTPDEETWIKNREKAISDVLNTIKGPLGETEKGRAWLSMNGSYISSTLYLQKKSKGALENVLSVLNSLIESEKVDLDVRWEMKVWAFLATRLLDSSLSPLEVKQAVDALEKNKGIVFSKRGFLFGNTDMSRHIGREIIYSLIFEYLDGKITK